ncbi:MAG: pseudaminic acid synthase [Candidatus Rokubacteria bacterium]|nr:pseudaminic acid synthase [Candidatus Rokubacteria bacterium]
MASVGPCIKIKDRLIGRGRPAYIVAEMSGNHNHDFDAAVRILHEAKAAGVDAVKLQTYTADTLTIDCDAPPFQIPASSMWAGRTLYRLYEEAYTPWEWQPKLKRIADGLGLDLFSTPFDASAVEFLESLEVPAYKIASFEVVDLELVRRIGQTGKPVIMSTGMATLAEIDEAVRVLRSVGVSELALLKCTSAYPAPPEEMNLLTMGHLGETFGVPFGLSDHTLGHDVAIAAVSLGASLIEKHLVLSRSTPGPDAGFSMEPAEMAELVRSARRVERALGSVVYGPTLHEKENRIFRRSLFVVADTKAGEPFTRENVRSIRPGDGLAPKHLEEVLGRRAARDIPCGTPLRWELVSG